jgi:hypothetical protein
MVDIGRSNAGLAAAVVVGERVHYHSQISTFCLHPLSLAVLTDDKCAPF